MNISELHILYNNTQEQYEGTPCMKFEFVILCYGVIILFICHLFNLVSSALDRFQGEGKSLGRVLYSVVHVSRNIKFVKMVTGLPIWHSSMR